MTTTITPLKPSPASARSAAKGKQGPGADRINQAFDDLITASVPRALILGQLLLEQRYALLSAGPKGWMDRTKDEDDQFATWLEKNCPKIAVRTAYRWMKGAENAARAIFPKRSPELIESGCIEVESEVMPISTVLLMEDMRGNEEPYQAAALELKQAYFDFAADKTMKECMAGVFLEGGDPTAITRAHNGRTAKGAGGSGDRKAFAQFTATKFKHITTFVNSQMPKTERALIVAAAAEAVKGWPKWFLEALVEKGQKELKLDDAERAARKGDLL